MSFYTQHLKEKIELLKKHEEILDRLHLKLRDIQIEVKDELDGVLYTKSSLELKLEQQEEMDYDEAQDTGMYDLSINKEE